MIHKEMLGCFNPCLGQMWTNPSVGFKNVIKKFKPTVGFVHILLQTWIFWEVARLFLSVFCFAVFLAGVLREVARLLLCGCWGALLGC